MPSEHDDLAVRLPGFLVCTAFPDIKALGGVFVTGACYGYQQRLGGEGTWRQ